MYLLDISLKYKYGNLYSIEKKQNKWIYTKDNNAYTPHLSENKKYKLETVYNKLLKGEMKSSVEIKLSGFNGWCCFL